MMELHRVFNKLCDTEGLTAQKLIALFTNKGRWGRWYKQEEYQFDEYGYYIKSWFGARRRW